MIDRPEEYEKMDRAENKLWWYKILHEQVLQSIRKKTSDHTIDILDAACGTGGLMQYLIQHDFRAVQGFDISKLAVQKSHAKTGKEIISLDLKDVFRFFQPSSFDVVVCNDALYFIEDNEFPKVLGDLINLVKPNGQLIINLPAGKYFGGMHDKSVGIKERWNYPKFKKMLQLAKAPYQLVEYRYWPFLLSPFIYGTRMIQRLKLKVFPSAELKSDVTLPSSILNEMFYKLTQLEKHLPFKKYIGSSLFVIIHR